MMRKHSRFPGEDMAFEVIVPEPASAGLFGLGLVLVWRRAAIRARRRG